MKKLLALAMLLCSLGAPSFAQDLEDDYIISPSDAPDADSYNERRGSFSADYDGDQTPNWLDPRNDAEPTPAWQQDWDHDGVINYLDPYDDDWLEP